MTSQGPRNNLKEILRSRPHDVSLVVSRTKPSSSSGTQGSKFKPANSTSNSQIGAVSVFPPFVLLATNLTRRILNDILEFGSIGSGILPSRPQGSSEVPSSSVMRRVSSSSKKRPSPDPAIFADDVTPPKRTRVERVSEKENFFSGSMNHKGKEKAAPPIYITPGPARDQMLVDSVGTTSQDSASVSAISRSLPLDYSDLSMKSEADLLQEYQDTLDFRLELMDWRQSRDGTVGTPYIRELLRQFDDVVNDRVLCTKAVLDARKRGQSPVLPPPRWAPATSVKGVRMQVDLARTSTITLPVFSSVRDTDFTSTSSSRQSAPSGNFQDGPSGSRIFEHTSSNTLFDDSDDDLWAQVDGEVSNQSTQNNSQIHVATTISDSSKVDTCPQTFTHPDVDERQMAELHDEIMSNLRRVFRLDSFRPNQYEAVLATLVGYDTFVLMATGGGKSLCYQLAAICQRGRAKGLTVVVTPLLALMVDQIRALESKKIDVVSFSGDQSSEEVRKIHERLFSSNKPSMLYVTPEKLDRSQGTRTLLKKLNLSHELARFIVDEAHCVSAWGRGFRESYTALSDLKKEFPNVPIMALTATATPQVEKDVKNILGINNCKRIAPVSLNRPNLYYEVRSKGRDVKTAIAEYIVSKHRNECGVVYCSSREKCEEYAKFFRERYHLLAKHFHAQVDAVSKRETQDKWSAGECHIIVATIAFGMGIDKADVRFVIHSTLPDRLDSYYQETGRAGRDGLPAKCVLYYSLGDTAFMFKRIADEPLATPEYRKNQETMLRQVMQYCHNDIECRRSQVLLHFGEIFDPQECRNQCDNCCCNQVVVEKDMTELAMDAVRFVKSLPATQPMPKTKFLMAAWGSQANLMAGPQGKGLSRVEKERLVDRLLSLGIFEQVGYDTGSGYPAHKLSATRLADEFLQRRGSNYPFIMKFKLKSTTSKEQGSKRTPKGRNKRNATVALKPAVQDERPLGYDLPDDPIMPYENSDEEWEALDSNSTSVPTQNLSEQGHSTTNIVIDDVLARECCEKLEELRDQISQNGSGDDLEFILTSEVLETMSFTFPEDMTVLKGIMNDAKIYPDHLPPVIFDPFLAICASFRQRAQNAPKAKPPSVDDLHKKYGFQV